MRRAWFALAVVLCTSAALAADHPLLRLDEDQVRFRLLPTPVLELPVVNDSGKPLDGSFRLELLDVNDQVGAWTEGTFHEEPGTTVEKLDWNPKALPTDQPSALAWYRLRYRFTPSADSGVPAATGVIQVGRVLLDTFELRMTASTKVIPGAKFPVRVRVDNPKNGRPMASVAVEVELDIGNDDNKPKRKVVTNSAGYATAVFDLPRKVDDSSGTVYATATRGAFEEEASIEFEFPTQNRFTLSTDKPLYQPGQTVHMRVTAFGPDKRALANARLKLVVQDEDQDEQFRQTVTTSRFGIASVDWQIPQKMRLGDFFLAASLDSDDNYQRGYARIRVSRYDLPTYTVAVKPDRPYYLPGQDASVEVRADYLFGKPVQHAKVRVVRRNQWRWSYVDQKWEGEEADPIEGEFDASGKFVAHISLKKDFEPYSPTDWQRYQDLDLAAYVTDLSTGRTEQRRFQLRLSAMPIQLYLLQSGSGSAEAPLVLYVTSSYADGTPASVEGTVAAARPNAGGKFDDVPDSAHRVALGRFRTNQYGVGRIELPPLARDLLIIPEWGRYYRGSEDDKDRNAVLLLEAADRKGNRGATSDFMSLTLGQNFLQVRADHALYRAGDPIEVSIVSNTSAQEAIVDVAGLAGLLATEVVHLSHGRAQITFPYDPRFHGALGITAYAITGSEEKDRDLVGSCRVIFPGRQELQLALRMAKSVYRPGEEAAADVGVRAPDGAPVESALGVLVFDRAVAERVRTDQQFGREYGFYLYDFLEDYYSQGIAGITFRDLLAWDSTQPFPEGLDLLGQALLSAGNYGSESEVDFAGGGGYASDPSSQFQALIAATTKPISEALDKEYHASERYPRDQAEVRDILKKHKVEFDAVLDPWAVPYRAVFSVSGENDVLSVVSDGPDKRPGTADDFTVLTVGRPYFRPLGKAINAAVIAYQRETHQYVRDYATLREVMKKAGTDLDALRDPWGRPYRFTFFIGTAYYGPWSDTSEASGPYYNIRVDSAGPDGVFDSAAHRSRDDVHEWTSSIHYFLDETAAIAQALAVHYAKTGGFPQTEPEFRAILDQAKLSPQQLLDPWGHPYRFSFEERSRYWDKVTIETRTVYGQDPRSVTKVTPVTQKVAYINVISDGPKPDREASFSVAEFSRVMTEYDARNITAMPDAKQPPVAGGRGTLRGTVTDPSGAVIMNAKVTAISEAEVPFTTTTDRQGAFEFTLPTGLYQLRVESQGFQSSLVVSIPVQEGSVTTVDVKLPVGAETSTVEVTAAPPMVQTTASKVVASYGKNEGQVVGSTAAAEKPLFTPRLRQYFPETLLWRPEVVTDARGRAHFNFTMADNITAWSMSVVATDEAGQVGIARKELRTFLPFFLEHDPPKVLTQGDTIRLPVVLRNYLDKPQTLQTEMKPESWFSLLSAPRQAVTVQPNADASAVFAFRATASVRRGKQRVTARNAATGDAVEREVVVHPDGEEVDQTSGRVLAGGNTAFDVNVPPIAIPGSIDGELRLYPNLVAHVFDAMRGIGVLPRGCAEQITSTAYVSLMGLRLLKRAGQDDPAAPNNSRAELARAARAAVQDGYLSLVDLQSPDGGFRYWKRTESDPALTAYVLRFLAGASEFVDVDSGVLARARAYLIKRQQPSGAWKTSRWRIDEHGDWQEELVEDSNFTAYITRSLAETMPVVDKEKEKDKSAVQEREQTQKAVAAALLYLEHKIDSWQDPYLVGNYAIAATDSGNTEHIANARDLLRQFAHREGAGIYWNLEANTSPFYGWGLGGRVETTALAVEALARMQARQPDPEVRDLAQGGLQYLLTHKDRYCIWYSTQATQNAVEAIISVLTGGEESAPARDATVLVNGRAAGTLHLPAARDLVGPVVLEIPEALARGNNRVEVSVPGGVAAMNAQMIASWYIPWAESSATAGGNFKPGDTRALRLKVSFDPMQAELAGTITAHVEAERVGFRGYGMMMAEIGLPPGAEVDRASLEAAEQGGQGISGYEVQPDRVVFYLWPEAGGSRFAFRFRLRYREDALSAPSLLYDYYNPESRAVVPPSRFVIH